MVQETWARPAMPVLGFQGRQAVDAAIGFGDHAVEERGADEAGDGVGLEEGEEGANHVEYVGGRV